MGYVRVCDRITEGVCDQILVILETLENLKIIFENFRKIGKHILFASRDFLELRPPCGIGTGIRTRIRKNMKNKK